MLEIYCEACGLSIQLQIDTSRTNGRIEYFRVTSRGNHINCKQATKELPEKVPA